MQIDSDSKEKILVFIPAYKCASQIVRVIDQFDADVQKWFDTIIVVDNRSPDDTLAAAKARASAKLSKSMFIAWTNDDNYGLGGSHKAAFCYAFENGFSHMVVLHGDDQADIHDLIPQLEQGAHLRSDCLLGARFMKGSRLLGYSKFRTFGNQVYNKLFSFVSRHSIHDLGSGLNMYRLAAFREFYFKRFPDDLTFNYVMLLASLKRKQSVVFFPISWREEDQVSNVKLFSQAFKVLGLLLKSAFQGTRFMRSEMRARPVESYSGKISS